MKNTKKPSSFIKVLCPRCKHQQVIFGKTATETKCKKCSYLLTFSTGGKAKVRALIKRILRIK